MDIKESIKFLKERIKSQKKFNSFMEKHYDKSRVKIIKKPIRVVEDIKKEIEATENVLSELEKKDKGIEYLEKQLPVLNEEVKILGKMVGVLAKRCIELESELDTEDLSEEDVKFFAIQLINNTRNEVIEDE